MASYLSPTTQNLSWNRTGVPPGITGINVSINESITVDTVRFTMGFPSSFLPWLEATGISSEYLVTDGFSADLPLNFINLDDLANGSYTANIYITLMNGAAIVKSLSATVTLTLTGTPPSAISTNKSVYNVVYRRDTDSLSGDSSIGVLNNSLLHTLEMESVPDIFKPQTGTTSFPIEENGSNPMATHPDLPLSGMVSVSGRVKKDGLAVHFFSFNLVVLVDDRLMATPDQFSFELRKGFNETKNALLKIVNPLAKAFTITKPTWLTLSASSGSADADITVTTVNSETIAKGDYNGTIEIVYDSGSITIPVSLKVISTLEHNFDLLYNFCLDGKFLTANKMSDEAFFADFRLNMLFRTDTETAQYESVLTIPYHKGQATVDIGKIVHRYFIRNRKNILAETPVAGSFSNQIALYPCVFDVEVVEKDINMQELYNETLHDLVLYPGKRPVCYPFMTNHARRSRVGGEKHIFSFISGKVAETDLFNIVVTPNLLPSEVIARVKVEESEPKINWVNPKQFAVTDPATDKETILFYHKLPTTRNLIHVQWENQNLSPESISFRGEIKFPVNKTHVTQRSIFSGNMEKLGTTNNRSLVVNTGYILQAEEDLIDELADSDFAIIEYKGKHYKGVPVASQITKLDSARELVEYEIEFLIDGN